MLTFSLAKQRKSKSPSGETRSQITHKSQNQQLNPKNQKQPKNFTSPQKKPIIPQIYHRHPTPKAITMKNARTHARTHALRIRIAPTAPQLLTPNPSVAPIITAAYKTHPTRTQNSTAFSTALKRPTARLTARNLSVAACRHNQFHILTVHPTEARQHPARAPRPVPPLRASRRAVCFFYSHHRLNDLDGIHKAN